MPQMPHPSVLGAFPFRDGRIVPLIDIQQVPEQGAAWSAKIRVIITEFQQRIQLLVSGVTRIHPHKLEQVVVAPTRFCWKNFRRLNYGRL